MGMDKPKAIYSILKYSLGAVNEGPLVDKVDSTLVSFKLVKLVSLHKKGVRPLQKGVATMIAYANLLLSCIDSSSFIYG